MIRSLIRVVGLLLIGYSADVWAQTWTLPSSSSTGNFSVSVGNDTYSWRLEEKINSTTWQTVGSGHAAGGVSITKPNGTYTYRLYNCYPVTNGCSTSSSKSITVSIITPVPPVGVTPLSPPTDSGSTTPVGALTGNFRVNEGGAANYEIPIVVPSGVAGVTPKISIVYNSQAANGLLGQGMNLSGISGISRCRQTLLQDGVVKPISWSAEDRYCLNGQRLMLVAGAYGSPGSLYKTEIDQYKKITAVGGTTGNPEYFTLEAKDGSTTYFGYDSEAANNSKTTLNNGYHVSWAQSVFADSVGNKIQYVYEGSVADGHRLKHIYYAYPSSYYAGTFKARVEFFYEQRTDISTSYMLGGWAFKNSSRLQYIRSYNTLNTESLYRKYSFDYSATGPTKLTSVSDCVTESSCYPATQFKWGARGNGFQSSQTLVTSHNEYTNHIFLDVNGDGKQEVVWMGANWDSKYRYIMYSALSSDGTWVGQSFLGGLGNLTYSNIEGNKVISPSSPNTTLYTFNDIEFKSIDYNADGRQDLLLCVPLLSDWRNCARWELFLSSPDLNGEWKLSPTPITMPFKSRDIEIGDVNSDGLMDVFTVQSNKISFYSLVKKASSYIPTNNYYQFSSPKDMIFSSSGFSYTRNPCYYGSYFVTDKSTIGDFNGDGLADIAIPYVIIDRQHSGCMYYPASGYNDVRYGHTLVFLSNGNNFTFSQQFSLNHGNITNSNIEAKMAPDINADGLTELVVLIGSTSHAYLNKGKQLTAIANFPVTNLMLGDDNGDGYSDLYWHDRNNQSVKYRLWNSVTESFAADVAVSGTKPKDSNFSIQDINGDGFGDLVESRIFLPDSIGMKEYYENIKAGTLWGLRMHFGNSDPKHNKIYEIADGFGKKKIIEYQPITAGKNYTTLKGVGVKESGQYRYEGVCPYYPSEDCKRIPILVADPSSFYKQINDPFPDNPDAYSKAPLLEVVGSMHVVTKVSTSNPIPSSSTNLAAVTYRYHEAKLQAGGRGFLGFKKLTMRDEQTGVTTETEYDQGWPFIGVPKSTSVRTSTGALLSESTSAWAKEKDAANDKVFRVYVDKTIDKFYGLKPNGSTSLLQTTETDTDYDAYGNTLKIVSKINGSTNTSTQTTINEYYPGDLALRWGRLYESKVTIQRNSESPITKTSRFDYYPEFDPKRGLLRSETLEPGAKQLITEYEYDAVGNKTTVKKSAYVSPGILQVRSTFTDYDENNRFVTDVYDSMGNLVSGVMARHPVYGLPTKIKDQNNVITDIYYNNDGSEKQRRDATGAWVHIKRWYCDYSTCPNLSLAKYKIETWVSGGGKTIEYYDLLGRVIRTSKLLFNGTYSNVDIEYNSRGLVSRKSEPYLSTASPSYWTRYDSYDVLGRATQTTLPNGAVLTAAFDGYKTTLTTQADGKTLTKTEEKNSLGNLVKITDSLGGTIEYGYDALGNLTSVLTSGSNKSVKVRMCYDFLGRKIAMHDPDKGGFLGNPDMTCSQVASYENDPYKYRPAGWWYYKYNDFGELISQVDTKRQVTLMSYDKLGRMISRTNRYANNAVDTHTSWYYDRPYGTTGAYPQYQGKLAAVVTSYGKIDTNCGGNNYCQTYTFDSSSRITDTVTYLPDTGTGYISSIKYDSIGRIDEVKDVLNGVVGVSGIKNMYNPYGYVGEIRDLATNDILQKTIEVNSRGQITKEKRLNGAAGDVTYDYFPQTGLMKTTKASVAGALFPIQDITYDWDAFGNLKSRWNQSSNLARSAKKNLQESFCYDGLNRLIKSNVGTLTGSCNITAANQDQEYDGLGNVTRKNGIGNYSYSGKGPHAVTATTVDGSYNYDDNGNQSTGYGRTITYSTYDQPLTITKGTHTIEFKYAPDRSRYARLDNKNGVKTLTHYFNGVERVEQLGSGVVEWKRYVAGAVYTLRTTTSTSCNTCYTLQRTDKSFVYNDHLGSLDVVVNQVGTITHSASFDAWGNRRSGENWTGTFSANSLTLTNYSTPVTKRGFTGHEMLDEVGIIHMNGRIYDPRLARFLQADPNIDGVANTQGFNRYSYVQNNPLNATDPTGYWAWVAWAIGSYIVGDYARRNDMPLLATIASVVGCIYGDVSGCAAASFGATYGSTGNLMLAAVSAFTAGAMSGLSAPLDKFIVGGMLGGVTSHMSGSEFGVGFWTAGMSAGLGAAAGGGWEGFAVATVVGGTTSEMTGGKFVNGAATAAFIYAVQWGAGQINNGMTGRKTVDPRTISHGPEEQLFGGKVLVTKENTNNQNNVVSSSELEQVKNYIDTMLCNEEGSAITELYDRSTPIKVILNERAGFGAITKRTSEWHREPGWWIFNDKKIHTGGMILTVDIRPESGFKIRNYHPNASGGALVTPFHAFVHEFGHALLGYQDRNKGFQSNIVFTDNLIGKIEGVHRKYYSND